jgi:hypothetical protein
MKTHTTRRAVMAGLAAAPVVGLPAVAGAVSAAPMSDALAQAIERHKAAWADSTECHDILAAIRQHAGATS